MRGSIRRVMGGFWASVILLAGLCGFAVVDFSTEYYMPGSFEPMLQISVIDRDGVVFAVMGKHYRIDSTPFQMIEQALEPWRLFLPAGPQWSALLAERAYKEAETTLERLRGAETD